MGLVAELGQAFEAWLNAKYAKGHLRMHVVFLPAARDALIPDLLEGKGDVVAGELTITPERQALVDFATPWVRDVKEVVVTGPNSLGLASLDDLAGKEAFVRASSAYSGNLRRLNADFAARGLPPITIHPIDEDLEDDDILQMVSAGTHPLCDRRRLPGERLGENPSRLKSATISSSMTTGRSRGPSEEFAAVAEGACGVHRPAWSDTASARRSCVATSPDR